MLEFAVVTGIGEGFEEDAEDCDSEAVGGLSQSVFCFALYFLCFSFLFQSSVFVRVVRAATPADRARLLFARNAASF